MFPRVKVSIMTFSFSFFRIPNGRDRKEESPFHCINGIRAISKIYDRKFLEKMTLFVLFFTFIEFRLVLHFAWAFIFYIGYFFYQSDFFNSCHSHGKSASVSSPFSYKWYKKKKKNCKRSCPLSLNLTPSLWSRDLVPFAEVWVFSFPSGYPQKSAGSAWIYSLYRRGGEIFQDLWLLNSLIPISINRKEIILCIRRKIPVVSPTGL